jgi:hypothetical protein
MKSLKTLKTALFCATALALTLALGTSDCRAQSPVATGKYVTGGLEYGNGEGKGFGAPATGGSWVAYPGGPLGIYLFLWDNMGSVFFVEPVSTYNNYICCFYYGYIYDPADPYNSSRWQYKEDGFLYFDRTTFVGGYGAQQYNGYRPSQVSIYYIALTP